MEKLKNFAPYIEAIFAAGLLISALALQLGKPVTNLMGLSICGLAIAFFLHAFRMPEVEKPEYPFTTQELFALTVLPKVMWLGAAIVSLGLAFHMFEFKNPGYTHMLYTGGFPLAFGTAVILVLLILRMRHVGQIAPILIRSIPLLVGVIYVLLFSVK